MKLPVLEDGQTSAMDEKEELKNNNEAMDTKTEKNYQLLTKFAKEKDLPVKTLRKIIYLLDERG
ncbi:FtsK/SpoIIIE domain-containing protein, partial [Streptococcus suis]